MFSRAHYSNRLLTETALFVLGGSFVESAGGQQRYVSSSYLPPREEQRPGQQLVDMITCSAPGGCWAAIEERLLLATVKLKLFDAELRIE